MHTRASGKSRGTIAAILLALAPGHACLSDGPSEDASILVEVEGFSELGDWVVDQQFIDMMGSPYLLAHGMGTPCRNARTTVTLPAPGRYRVWVRTKDWIAEPAWAPGRFRVLIDGRPLATTFGTEGGGKWIWQDGGTVEIDHEQVPLELEDETGFEGRCDAIYFTTNPAEHPPEAAGEAIMRWRAQRLGLAETPKSAGRFEVVVVGGGLAGCAAAVTASRQGCKVALVQNRPVFGGNNSSEIGVHTGRWGIPGRIITPELGGNYGAGPKTADWWKKVEQNEQARQAVLDAEDNITQFLGWHVFRAAKQGDRIESVDALNIYSNERLRFSAPVFIDCTGDGWVGYHAGADFRYGQEGRQEHNEPLAPPEASDMTLGSTLQWYSADTGRPVGFPEVPWATAVAGDLAATSGGWTWEYGHYRDTIWEAEEIRDHLFRAIYGAFANAKTQEPEKNAPLALARVNYIAGKRESRRLLGDYIMTQADCWNDTVKRDKVAQGGNPFDLHVPTAEHNFLVKIDERVALSERRLFDIPFRCLYSRNVSNLMMAGRCVSATRIAHAAMRIQNTGAQNGVAVGAAAALCARYGMTPREVGGQHLAELQGIVFAEGVNTEPLRERAQATVAKRYPFPSQLDQDGDGLISTAEWNRGKPDWKWLPPLIDTSGDGRIDPEEYAAFQQYKIDHPDWRRQKP